MRYLCLGYYDPAAYDALSDAEREELGRVCAPMDEELRATGRLRAVASLAHRASKVLRPAEDGPTVTDGPFAESKEVVGAFFVVEADDLDEAVEIASLHPAARWGEHLGWAVEVRPIERFERQDQEN
ncbi:MAG: YciI family protein [Gemmatimonadota bacterium]